jgi:AraC-like DNA-binding protein
MPHHKALWRFFSFGEETHPAGQRYWFVNRNRLKDIHVLQYTLQGRLRYHVNGEESIIGKDQALLFGYNDGSEYGIRPRDKSYTTFWISLCGAGLGEHWKMIQATHGSILTDSHGELLRLMRESVRHICGSDEQDPLRIAERTYQFVMQLMELLDRQSRHLISPAERAVVRMCRNPYYLWSIKELTKEEGCSREHFFRVFKQRHQTTPTTWLSQRRTEHARYLLQTTRLTVEDIALQCGFSGAHGLSRALRTRFGQSPSQMRSARIMDE